MTELTAPPTPLIPQLIIGLGNPEPKYDQTRHNIGFAAVDALSRSWQIPLSEHRKFQGIFGEGMVFPGQKIRLLKPLTYMNRSGQSIRAAVDWYKLSPASILVIYDDMDLPLGKLRLRLAGSAGGHNGMKSAIAHLGTSDFPRLRIGIGKPVTQAPSETDTISHVLGNFSKAESQLVGEVLNLVRESIEASFKFGVEKAMSLYNPRAVSAVGL
ncbi:peptidyl-tRNA hydrolase [Neosynechococcus sphagnicola sy1]|uniref:Peptidyl-tRNA hydrolase n=1 Tax=Neosynechococcus sphagnicola sy1 TaxID=1497020 RepID=A0A098TPS0_9CYAN|nr:aminoacyl-tRNA hydrolase [Neosynechococcus sphagnicola]KGF72828.1 peptidyl-tRNA hydrolase [Neosynechococcus sphagnicola sy1]